MSIANNAISDPKAFDERSFVPARADSVMAPLNGYALAVLLNIFVFPGMY
jgi:hypothetical protein